MLIVEDDRRLMQCLARAMEARGFKVIVARSVCDGLAQIQLSAPEYAVVDMRFDDGCGLDIIEALKQQRPDARAIILTGYGNIATAVKAVKLGAIDYLTKPVDADDIVSALLAPKGGLRRSTLRRQSYRPWPRWQRLRARKDGSPRIVRIWWAWRYLADSRPAPAANRESLRR